MKNASNFIRDTDYDQKWHEANPGKPIRRGFGRWDDPVYLAQLEEENALREVLKLPITLATYMVAEPVSWVYQDLIAVGELTVVVGGVGTGKTTLMALLAAGVTVGSSYTGLGAGVKPKGSGYVIYINREDNIQTTILPRLKQAGVDMSLMQFIGKPFSFSNPSDVNRLRGLAKILKNNIGMIILDPLYLAVDGDFQNNSKSREAYEALVALARELRCAIVGVAHAVKMPRGKDPLSRVAGAPAVREVPRALLLLTKRTGKPTPCGGTHVLVRIKNNVGRSDGGYAYRIEEVEVDSPNGPVATVRLELTEELAGTAEEILAETERETSVESISKLDAAKAFLRRNLQDGPRLRIDIDRLAEESGVTSGTLINAKNALRIVTKKRTGDGRSEWRLLDIESDDISDSDDD